MKLYLDVGYLALRHEELYNLTSQTSMVTSYGQTQDG
jgi:hypothetical protein